MWKNSYLHKKMKYNFQKIKFNNKYKKEYKNSSKIQHKITQKL